MSWCPYSCEHDHNGPVPDLTFQENPLSFYDKKPPFVLAPPAAKKSDPDKTPVNGPIPLRHVIANDIEEALNDLEREACPVGDHPRDRFGNASGPVGSLTVPLELPDSGKKISEAQRRKNQPIARGVLDYFPDALLAVAELSRIGNEQHNPGQPLHWAKEKSTDEADALVRHLLDRGTFDTDGVRHSAKVAWRALALLQRELDAALDISTPP